MADLVATTGTAVSLCAGVGLTFINIQSVVTDSPVLVLPFVQHREIALLKRYYVGGQTSSPQNLHRYYRLEQILTFV